MERDSFTFYRNHYEIIKSLSAEMQLELFTAIMELSIYGNSKKLSPTSKMIFELIRPQIDISIKNYRNGLKGGAPKGNNNAKKTTQKQPKNNPKTTQKQPTSKAFEKPIVSEIESYCNERNNGIDAEKFYNFYESKGWMVGSNKMKDWRACVRTWEKKNNHIPKTPKQLIIDGKVYE